MNSTASPVRRSWLRRGINRLEVDRATFYSITGRLWQLAAGPVSLLVIALALTPELQGYYYTFASLMALQSLVELGLHAVMINMVSHEWAALSLTAGGEIAGDERSLTRLAWLARFGFRWYGCVAAAFVAAVGTAGWIFFRQRPDEVAWEAPWIVLVALTGGVLWLWGLTALLEGCNQMATVHWVRLLQAATGTIVVWACLLGGWGLWAVAASALIRLLWDAWLVWVRYGAFFRMLFRRSVRDAGIRWGDEFWPLQWRMGVRAIVGYFAFNLFTPILFHYHGAAAAGQLGMTWTVLTALESAAFAWVQTRIATMGMLIARRDYVELDRVFRRVTGISWLLLFLGYAAVCGAVVLLNLLPWELAQKLSSRLLPVEPTVLFCLAAWLFYLPRCEGVYILAHKRDPLLWPGVIPGLLVALFVWLGAREWGATGEAAGYLAVVAFGYIPLWTWIWLRCRREWHADLPSTLSGAP